MANSTDKLAKELKKQITASDERKPKPYDTQAEVLRVEDGVAWVHIPGGVDETPVRLTINAKKGDNVNLHVANGTAWITGNSTNPPTDDSTANYAVNISNEVKKDITVLNTVVAENIEATNARFINVEADTAKIHTLTAEKILATVGYIEDLTTDSITANDISAASGYIKDLEADNITAQDISASSGYIKDLTAGNVTAQNVITDHATVGSLDANYAQIDMANVNNAWIENGAIKKAEVFDENVFDLSGNRATLSRIDASKINVANLRADNLIVRRINGQPVVGGYTLIDSNSPGYSSKNPQALGWYEFVNAQWVLSTDTTVNMAKAYYQEGNEVSLYDQQYIDTLENDLQQQIDGAVETYTGTVVPTLVNKPYTDWYDTSVTPIHDERAKHVGDIYYVVNSAASENGYCYRFAYYNTTHAYSWVLIKDSDVTKALSDISELKTFESDTTSWIEETDEGLETIRTNHTTLAGVVDKTVKESIQLWYTKANTTAPNKPTAEVTSTSTSGNAWRKVVPAWNASYPNYYYCWQYKFVDGTFGWSDVVRDIAMGETQGTARDAKNTADAALPASTFTSFESTTFKNVKDTVDEQTTKFTNMTTRLGLNSDGTGANTDIVAKESALEQTVDGISTRVGKTETKLIGMYATSSTAAGTAAKVATITPALPSGATWELGTGTIITVKFTNANTAANPTLNVNSKGAKAIKTYANGNLTEDEYKWKAGSTFTFIYNGTNWLMQDSSASVRMNSAETGITQNAEQIALRAKSSDVYTKGQVYTKTEADSAITQKANEISLSVAQTEISKIEVGGRNLLTGTSESKELTTAANQNWFSPQPYKLSAYANTAIADTSNTKITISFDYSATGVDTAFNMTASLRTSTASGGTYGAGVKVAEIPVGDSSGHAAGTRNITSDMRNNAPGAGIMISGSGNANANAVVTISNVKLEFGNKATDWSPAPEDLENYADGAVATAKAEIKVTTDSISTEVSKKVGNNEVISKINQSPEEITIDASRVNIAGAAIFSNYATTAQLNSEVNARKAVYATSSTAAGTKAKVADCSNFALYTGASVAVTFSNANTHATPTLNVNGTGAKNIKGYTGAALTEAEYKWIANSTVTFTYDGTNWRMQDGGALQAKAAAAASASTASTKASEASTSATNAATSASTASSKASEASTSATNAASSASTASSKASSASISATNAATSASTASTKASEASTSATNAATSASTASTKASEAATSATAAAEVMGGFTILWNYENFSTANNGEGYICAFDPKTGSKSDANGWVKWNGTKRTISKQMIDPNTILPYNIPIYVVCRLSSATATTGTNYLVWYKSGWKYAALPTPTAVGGDWTWTEATDIILGKFAEPSSEEAFTDCEIYNPPRSSKHITTNTVTAGSAQATANAAAPKSSAVAEEQYIYISKASGTTSVSGTTTWITETGDKQNTWTAKRPTYNSSYPVLFVAKQKKVVSGTVTCTTPVKDDTTTVIDGGHITTGTIDSNRLNANTIKVNAANIQGSLTIGQLPSTVAETSDIPTKVSELSNDSGYQTSSQVSSAINNVRSWYATCSTAAGTAAKVATITPTTTAFTTSVLTAGTLVNVKFTVTNTAAVGDLTLNINNTGAKHIKTLRCGVINNIAGVGYLAQNVTYQFTYDGTYWVMQENYNSDTINRTRWQNVIAAAEAITNGHIICGTASGYRNIAANVSFDMSYPLLYAATTIAKGATSGTRDNNFLEINGINASVNGTITSGAANKILFLKGTLTGNTFKISASPFLTTVVPTSQDNLCYIPLGIMYSATNIYFKSSDQIYAYKDGAFGPISMREASAAAKTATTYITHIDNNGIRIHPASTENRSVTINAEGMSIWAGNTNDPNSKIASFGGAVTIGQPNSTRILITNNMMQAIDFNGNPYFSIANSNGRSQNYKAEVLGEEIYTTSAETFTLTNYSIWSSIPANTNFYIVTDYYAATNELGWFATKYNTVTDTYKKGATKTTNTYSSYDASAQTITTKTAKPTVPSGQYYIYKTVKIRYQTSVVRPFYSFGEDVATTGGANSFVIGEGTIANSANALAIGTYNADSGDDIFMIGFGTSNTSRKNIISVGRVSNTQEPSISIDESVDITIGDESIDDFVIMAGTNYRMWNSGISECWVSTTKNVALNGAYGSLYTGNWTWTFPSDVVFIENPTVICSQFKWGTGASWGTVSGVTTTNATLRGLDAFSRASGSCAITAYAIGRWK